MRTVNFVLYLTLYSIHIYRLLDFKESIQRNVTLEQM